MKKKENGFTLVELLVVIVVLALIMIITIPSVLDVMNDTRKNSFVLYAQKVVKDAQTQYVYDSNLGTITGSGWYVYDITSDLGYTSTGNYKGYVIVYTTASSETKYYLTLYDNNYQILLRNISDLNDATTSDIDNLKNQDIPSMADPVNRCHAAQLDANVASNNNYLSCQNRNGYILTNK